MISGLTKNPPSGMAWGGVAKTPARRGVGRPWRRLAAPPSRPRLSLHRW